MTRAIDRLAAWLCLALLLVTGLVPAHGYVVCLEGDGCVSVELKAPEGGCGACEGHDEHESPGEATLVTGTEASCPCIDLAVPSSPNEMCAQSRISEVELATWIAPTLAFRFERVAPMATGVRGPPQPTPRVAVSLAHIRSVILLV